jgi:hypothetical protein
MMQGRTRSVKGRKGSLDGSQYSHATDVGVFAVHVVREDDDLEDVRVYRFAKNKKK